VMSGQVGFMTAVKSWTFFSQFSYLSDTNERVVNDSILIFFFFYLIFIDENKFLSFFIIFCQNFYFTF
jgi:hypothetical protein